MKFNTMTLLEVALKYLDMGLPIFPVSWDEEHKKRKKALVKWEKYQEELPTKEDVKNWWHKWPDAGIAMATGRLSGIIVLDAEKEAKLDLFPELKDLETTQVKSGGGGNHFWFAYEPQGNRTKFAPAFDFRGDGGYILLPPSPHESGNQYEWLIPYGSVPLAPLLPGIREALKKSNSLSYSSVANLLKTEVREGERNQSATAVAGSLLSRFSVSQWETHGWPLLEAWNRSLVTPSLPHVELRAVWESIKKTESLHRTGGIPLYGEGEYKPYLEEQEDGVRVRIQTGEGTAGFYFRELEQKDWDEVNTIVTVEFAAPGRVSIPITNRMNILSASAKRDLASQLKDFYGKVDMKWLTLVAMATEAVHEWFLNRETVVNLNDVPSDAPAVLFPPFLVEGSPNMLFGDGGTGKTFLALRIAVALAMDGDFLGRRPNKPCTTLFVDYEDTERTASYRIGAICKGLGLDEEQTKRVKDSIGYFRPEGRPLASQAKAIKEVVRKNRYGLLLVDSVATACGGDATGQEAASMYYNALQKIGITSLSLAHVTKGEAASDGKQDKSYGSVFWHNFARNTWNVQGEDETEGDDLQVLVGIKAKQLGMFHRKCNSGPKTLPIPLRIVYGDSQVVFEQGNLGFWETRLALPIRILRLLSAKPLTLAELCEALPDERGATVEQTLRRLKNVEGKIDQPGGKGTAYIRK